jgi:hypothetical protein
MSEPENEDAPPSRVAFYNHGRRGGLVAVIGLLAIGSLVVWAVYRFVNS